MSEVSLKNTFLRGDNLCFKDCIIEEDKIIFSACNYNGLYQYDRKKQKLEYLGAFKNENILTKSMYCKIVKHDKTYIFIPHYARTIGVYNFEKKRFDSMELPVPQYACHSGGKFQTAKWFENKLYLIPALYSYILEIDFEKNQMQVYDNWNDEKTAFQSNVELGFGMGCIYAGRFIYLPVIGSNRVLKFDLKNKIYEFSVVQMEHIGLYTLAFMDNHFYAATLNGTIIKFNVDGGNVKILGKDLGQFGQYIDLGEKFVCLFEDQNGSALVINTENDVIEFREKEETSNTESYDSWESRSFWFVKKLNNKEIEYMDRAERILKIIDVGSGNAFHVESEEIFIDDTGAADKKISVADYYQFQIEYHDEVAQTLGYRKPMVILEQLDNKDSIRFMLDWIEKSQRDIQRREGTKDMGRVIWEELRADK